MFTQRGFYFFVIQGDGKMLNKNISLLRKYNELSIQQVADALGIGAEQYAAYESGEALPDSEVIENLAKLYNVTIDQLFFGMDRFGKPFNAPAGKNESESGVNEGFEYLSELTAEEKRLIIALRLSENNHSAAERLTNQLLNEKE